MGPDLDIARSIEFPSGMEAVHSYLSLDDSAAIFVVRIESRPEWSTTDDFEAALGRAVKLLAFGSAAGLLLGILASRILAAVVFEATPRDPFVLAGVVLAMALVGLLATWIPAQRALSIDPVMLLREE